MSDSRPPAILLMGPTASGKTRLAIELTQHLPCDIISVDSAMVYRGMDIGTAKPSTEEQAIAPHRLIDICDPADSYSAARFRQDAVAAMEAISATGRLPLLVGGTMLYFRVLQSGLSLLPSADPELRQRLEGEARDKGWKWMHQRLAKVDPTAAARIHPNDPQRIQRALEVYEITGTPLSILQANTGRQALPYHLIKLARCPDDRDVLRRRIEQRFHRMLADGFEEEVRTLWSRGDLRPELPSMRMVGYRQMLGYVRGCWDRSNMIERGLIATRQLAKRQLTWLRSELNLHWLDEERGQVLKQALKIIDSGCI